MQITRIKLMPIMAAVCALASAAVLADDRTQMQQLNPTTSNAAIETQTEVQWDRQPFSSRRGEEIIGAKVENTRGEELGQLKDLAIDPTSGRIVYGVLTLGGFLGAGEKYLAIPWRSLQKGAEGDYVLNVEAARLKNAEGFDHDQWPDMADSQWVQATHSSDGRSSPQTTLHSSVVRTSTGDPNRFGGSAPPAGTNTPAGPYAQRRPGIVTTTGHSNGDPAGVLPATSGDPVTVTNAGQINDSDRQVAYDDSGRAEFKSSVEMLNRQPASANIVKASELIGERVENPQKESLGSIKDLAIDSNNGRISSVVLARGGVLGVGDELYAIPWPKLSVRMSENKDGDRPSEVDVVIVNVDNEMLKSAPSFSTGSWPSDDDSTYFVTVYRYYAVPQYWQ